MKGHTMDNGNGGRPLADNIQPDTANIWVLETGKRLQGVGIFGGISQ